MSFHLEVAFPVNRSYQEAPPSRQRRTLVEVSRQDIRKNWGVQVSIGSSGERGERERERERKF